MYIYWITFIFPAMFALTIGKNTKDKNLWILISIIFILLIGLRYEVGCDWFPYLNYYNQLAEMTFKEIFFYDYQGDPGHKFVNWFSSKLNLGIYGVNLIYSSIFIYGLIKFSRAQPYPWIAFSAAIPYLLIVVAMGYSRQGVAIGLILIALSNLNKDAIYRYIFLVIIAALFHKTSILMLPLSLFILKKKFFIQFLIIIPILFFAWQLILADKLAPLYQDYIVQQMTSAGTYIRIIMNIIPGIILLFYKKEWNDNFNDYNYWFWITIIAILSIGFIQFASTAIDRVGLYFIPLQLVVFSRLPILARKNFKPNFIKASIILLYSVTLYIWLNFAFHAKCWLPYKNYFFEGMI